MTEETFEEKFPSLSGKQIDEDYFHGYGIDGSVGAFDSLDIQETTVDKAIVERDYVSKEKLISVIKHVFPLGYAYSDGYRTELLRELGLEGEKDERN